MAENYGDAYFFAGGAGYPNYLDEATLLRSRGRRYARKLSAYLRTGRCLDVGSAAGFLLKGFEDEGWSCVGLEPNATMVDHGRHELGLEMVQGTLENCTIGEAFDLVLLVQVVAHLNDLPRSLKNLSDLCRPDGHVLIETWNQESLTARILGPRWHEYSPPSVLHWFTPVRLAQLMEQFGFEQVKTGRTIKWISVRHAASLLTRDSGEKASGGFIDKIPPAWRVPYPSEDLFWSLYRKT